MKDIFFIEICRRPQYSTKQNGEFYASYNHYQQEIREDCQGYCVYCDCHENEIGGKENMNLDHFQPQDLFPNLASDPRNLVWSCGGCNRLKSHHWPVHPAHANENRFLDRFQDDVWDFITVDDTGHFNPISNPAAYYIGLLALNRTPRKRLRELRLLKAKWIFEFDSEINEMQTWFADCNDAMRKRLSDHIMWLIQKRDEMKSELINTSLQ
jgi:uncharacterized protein (TIGR02646 family)